MPVEILHDLVGEHTRGSVVETGDLSPGVLRRLLDLGAVRMVPADAPEKPLELTPEQQRLVNENAELSDRLDALEREVAALRIDNGKLRQDLGCSQELLGETQQQLLDASKARDDLRDELASCKQLLADNIDAALSLRAEIIMLKQDLSLEKALHEAVNEPQKPVEEQLAGLLTPAVDKVVDEIVEKVQTSAPAPKKPKK